MNYEPRMQGSGLIGGATHRENILKKYKLEDKGYSLEELSKITSTSLKTLQEVYNRGIGAYKTNPTSVRMKGSYKKGVDAPMSKKLSKEQWAMARVYSYLDGNPKHDSDLKGGCRGCMGACGGSMVKFHKQLKSVGLTHDIYMKKAKELAKASGYDPEKLSMSEDENHKLCYDGVCFGKIDYYDYIIYSWLESKGELPEGTADKKRKAYRARASKARGDWKSNRNSPNNLAINILW